MAASGQEGMQRAFNSAQQSQYKQLERCLKPLGST